MASDAIPQYAIIFLAILTTCVSCAILNSKLILREKMLGGKLISKHIRCWSSRRKYFKYLKMSYFCLFFEAKVGDTVLVAFLMLTGHDVSFQTSQPLCWRF